MAVMEEEEVEEVVDTSLDVSTWRWWCVVIDSDTSKLCRDGGDGGGGGGGGG